MPNVTRWNSVFDAVKTLNGVFSSDDKKQALEAAITQYNLDIERTSGSSKLCVAMFTNTDMEYFREYERVSLVKISISISQLSGLQKKSIYFYIFLSYISFIDFIS